MVDTHSALSPRLMGIFHYTLGLIKTHNFKHKINNDLETSRRALNQVCGLSEPKIS